MQLLIDNKEKGTYKTPSVVCVQLDNEISLALASAPPHSGDEVNVITPLNLKTDPFSMDLT